MFLSLSFFHFRSSVWVAPKENPLEFQYFRKNFLDFKDDYQYCYNSSEYNSQGRSLNIKNSKKKVSYADSKKFVSLGFRVLWKKKNTIKYWLNVTGQIRGVSSGEDKPEKSVSSNVKNNYFLFYFIVPSKLQY